MTTPKHLWSGDWEEESDAAAARRRGMAPLPVPAPEAETGAAAQPRPEPARAPSGGAKQSGAERAHRPPRRVPWRAVAIAGLTALVIVAAAFGVGALLGSGKDGGAVARPGWLGLKLGVLPGSAVVVTGFEHGSPARPAGLRVGDQITEVQGRPVAAPVDVRLAVEALSEGDTIELVVQRGSHPYTVRIRLGGRSPQSSP